MLNLILRTIKRSSRSRLSMMARQMYLRMKIPMDFPIIINVDPTNACNLLCTMCPNSQPPSVKKRFLDMDLYEKIVSEISARKKRIYRFFLVKDGEPLLHKNIIDMVALAKEKNISQIVTVVTNGVLLDSRKSRAFIECGLDDIGISLDAASRETYLKTKGRDSYDAVVDNILHLQEMKKSMRKKRPVVRLKFVETPENTQEKQAFIKKWKGKVEKLEINPLHDWAGSMRLDQTGELKQKSERYPCSLLWYTMVINCDGSVSLCCIDYGWKTVVGNVREKSLSDVWNSREMEEVRMRHVRGDYDQLPVCNTCTYWKIKENIRDFLKKKYKNQEISE
ncbi:MAG: radical SAM protein [Candidatus Aureabacteria bacterium]|nr:radical SAM protein [Candidatus Auribacterota bacterium]